MSLEILFKDEHFVATNKPSGLLVHPYWKETNEKECLLKDLRDQIDMYLYPIHRLDRPVSGIVIFGLNQEAVRSLQSSWHEESTRKIYTALARGRHESPQEYSFALRNEQKVEQEALTLTRPKELFERSTLLEVEIKTGRRHQIRRHLSRRIANVIGDRKYGKKAINDHYRDIYGIDRIFLHATQLSFIHPITEKEVEINCPLPVDLQNSLSKMRQREFTPSAD
ncbi:MAG: pseudouridylate synthase [Halobacteriovoraceae bacterium]|nr:pseudouridylate synthase [Halobacteriovoraceae bacterium]